MNVDAGETDNPFWDFSIRLYAKPGVAPACLDLQERNGLDVNVLLYCAWQGAANGRALSAPDVWIISSSVAAWHDKVVRRLRAIRSDMKGDPKGAPGELAERLRAQIKRDELDAERIEQRMLFGLDLSDAPRAMPSTSIARKNMLTYLESLGIRESSADSDAIELLLAALDS